jgi:integrase-like protein
VLLEQRQGPEGRRSVILPRLGIGAEGARVVVADHDDEPWPEDRKERLQPCKPGWTRRGVAVKYGSERPVDVARLSLIHRSDSARENLGFPNAGVVVVHDAHVLSASEGGGGRRETQAAYPLLPPPPAPLQPQPSVTRYLPLHPGTNELIHDYLEAAGHGEDENGALFRPIRNNRTAGSTRRSLPTGSTGWCAGIQRRWVSRSAPHALRATAATNALDHQADIAKVQEWLGHANIATTRIYDHRKTRPGDSPTFKVNY